MSTNYHTPYATGMLAKASLFNAALEELDQAITDNATSINGTLTHNMASDANYTLSASEALNKVVKITDTGVLLTTTRNIVVPTASKIFYFVNSTAQSLVPKTASGTGPTVTTGHEGWLRCDGTNVVQMTPSW